jgi:hypothetical protein
MHAFFHQEGFVKSLINLPKSSYLSSWQGKILKGSLVPESKESHMRNKWTALAIGAMIASGCVQFNSQLNLKGTTLVLKPSITEGSRYTQTELERYTTASINHLVLDIYDISGGPETPMGASSKDISAADLGNSIVFSNLSANHAYRIKAYAYKAAGTAAGDLISENASSSTDVAIGASGGVATASFKIKLIDTFINASGSASGWDVTDGGILPAGNEAVN